MTTTTDVSLSLREVHRLIPEVGYPTIATMSSRRLPKQGSGNYRRYSLAEVAVFRFCVDNGIAQSVTQIGGPARVAMERAILDGAESRPRDIAVTADHGRFVFRYAPRWVTPEELAAAGLA